jgi:hypothetical protein
MRTPKTKICLFLAIVFIRGVTHAKINFLILFLKEFVTPEFSINGLILNNDPWAVLLGTKFKHLKTKIRLYIIL